MRAARPNLKTVSPLAYWTVLVMAIFNILLGTSFVLALDQSRITASFIIVNDVLTFKFWGFVFIAIGLIKAYSLLTNNWKLARQSLIIGVSIKAMWAVALIVRALISPGTVFVGLLWVTIALLQMGSYIWFMPQITESGKQDKK